MSSKKSKQQVRVPHTPPAPLKLDLGCGPNKREGFIGVDERQFDGKVDVVTDLRKKWPWKDDSVDEVVASHFLEHLDGMERVHFVNELYRVLKVGAKAQIVTPHWAAARAYGDLTHKWPPVSEFWYAYLDSQWRKINAPHNDFYKCDFVGTHGFSLRQDLLERNTEYQLFAMSNYKEACQDLHATITKR